MGPIAIFPSAFSPLSSQTNDNIQKCIIASLMCWVEVFSSHHVLSRRLFLLYPTDTAAQKITVAPYHFSTSIQLDSKVSSLFFLVARRGIAFYVHVYRRRRTILLPYIACKYRSSILVQDTSLRPLSPSGLSRREQEEIISWVCVC